MFDKYKQIVGIKQWTKVQEDVFSNYKQHAEIISYSPTGSGKTLAFLLPLVELIDNKDEASIALILAPTRELALQIEEVFKSLKTDISSTCCYGGHSMKVERNNLEANPTLIIGTPGRIHDHLRRGNLSFDSTELLIVDEFDKCLELGFQEDIGRIYSEIKLLRKSFFTSATAIDEFPAFVQFSNPVTLDHSENEEAKPDLNYYSLSSSEDDWNTLLDLIPSFKLEPSILFCNFREDVDDLHDFLSNEGIRCIAYHGGLEQEERERALIKFKNGSNPLLICTDLGARGLDIPLIKNIVHVQIPDQESAFIHRNGRTARMFEDGNVFFFEEDRTTSKFDLPNASAFQIKKQRYIHPEWITVYVSGGKKNKINKIDIVGFFCQKGDLNKDQLGIISVLDYSTFVAVKSNNIKQLLVTLRQFKLKGKKVRIAIAK